MFQNWKILYCVQHTGNLSGEKNCDKRYRTLLFIVTGKQMIVADLIHLCKMMSLNATISFTNFIF